MTGVRLNLKTIEESLLAVQHSSAAINAALAAARPPMTDEARSNMMEGYSFIDYLITNEINLYEPGNSSPLLELNNMVLCGSNQAVRTENYQHIVATNNRFYERQSGDIDEMIALLNRRFAVNTWRRAATAYIHILSQPQLYIEGNHRTGALIMSYILLKEGSPPFVLTPDNAQAYFELSTEVKETQLHGLDRFHKIPRLTVLFAKILKENLQDCHLLS